MFGHRRILFFVVLYINIKVLFFAAANSSSDDSQENTQDLSVKSYSASGLRIAILTGHIGEAPVYIPNLPHNSYDCYFLTNNEGLAEAANAFGWNSVLLMDIPLVDSMLDVSYAQQNAASSKQLKVFPQRFLSKEFDFIVWFDNKYNLLVGAVLDTIMKWDSTVAMMLHTRYHCCGADLEFTASMLQPRYAISKQQMTQYMEEEIELGYPVHGERHFQTGFIIYNMNHKDTLSIQQMWQEHIERVGINCQIAFYFVAQRFPRSIQEYFPDWQNMRYSVVTYGN